MASPSPLLWTAPPLTSDGEAVLRWVRGLSADELAWLAPEFSSGRINEKRRAERDQALLQLAVQFSGRDREQARKAHQAVNRYVASAWRFDRESDHPHDQRNAILHKITRLNDGKPLSLSTVRRALMLK